MTAHSSVSVYTAVMELLLCELVISSKLMFVLLGPVCLSVSTFNVKTVDVCTTCTPYFSTYFYNFLALLTQRIGSVVVFFAELT